MRRERHFEAVIFDMDGVLVDSEPLHYESTVRVLAEIGVRFTTRENDEFVGFTDLAMFERLVARHRLPVSPEDLAARRVALILERVAGGMPAMPGVPDVPRRL